jgi:hypothetical protein
METLTAKLDGTRRHLITETGALFTRTREAGTAFVLETRRAGAAFARAARSEARGWARFLRTRPPAGARAHALSELRPALERRVLTRVDAAITTVGQRVRARLGELPATARLGAAPPPRRGPVKARPRRARRPRTAT